MASRAHFRQNAPFRGSYLSSFSVQEDEKENEKETKKEPKRRTLNDAILFVNLAHAGISTSFFLRAFKVFGSIYYRAVCLALHYKLAGAWLNAGSPGIFISVHFFPISDPAWWAKPLKSTNGGMKASQSFLIVVGLQTTDSAYGQFYGDWGVLYPLAFGDLHEVLPRYFKAKNEGWLTNRGLYLGFITNTNEMVPEKKGENSRGWEVDVDKMHAYVDLYKLASNVLALGSRVAPDTKLSLDFCVRVALLRAKVQESPGQDYWNKVDEYLEQVRVKKDNDAVRIAEVFGQIYDQDILQFDVKPDRKELEALSSVRPEVFVDEA
ncbi:hypothetical protein B0H14DRAFT_3710629 [Mycena olivaceomarginata]|nr:hypothetical protein B0H14DRAFT_3710629 [Mycena olivaceomarginata]